MNKLNIILLVLGMTSAMSINPFNNIAEEIADREAIMEEYGLAEGNLEFPGIIIRNGSILHKRLLAKYRKKSDNMPIVPIKKVTYSDNMAAEQEFIIRLFHYYGLRNNDFLHPILLIENTKMGRIWSLHERDYSLPILPLALECKDESSESSVSPSEYQPLKNIREENADRVERLAYFQLPDDTDSKFPTIVILFHQVVYKRLMKLYRARTNKMPYEMIPKITDNYPLALEQQYVLRYLKHKLRGNDFQHPILIIDSFGMGKLWDFYHGVYGQSLIPRLSAKCEMD